MRICLLTAVMFTASVAAPASAQVPTGRANVDRAYAALDGRTRGSVEAYLQTDCELGEVGVALRALLATNGRTRPYLIAVQQEGPPSQVLAAFDRGLENTWQARDAYLRTPDAQELGKEAFDQMRAITKAAYLAEQQKGIQAKYRERAALALKAMAASGR
jgi:hypothetical protein